jgi:hypothetical protein
MSRRVELTVAVASFAAAVAFAFASLAISEAHEVAAGNCSVIAQFLLLTASIFGIDYKFSNRSGNVSTNVRTHKQPPAA